MNLKRIMVVMFLLCCQWCMAQERSFTLRSGQVIQVACSAEEKPVVHTALELLGRDLKSILNDSLLVEGSEGDIIVWTAGADTGTEYHGVDLSACKSEADKQAKLQEFQYAYQQRQAYAQAEFNYQNDLLTAQFDMYREANLEPLKIKEDTLATEKATLETRIQTLSDQEKAAQEMEKQGAKDMAPDYTGQGQ